jgi:hypothetical protein
MTLLAALGSVLCFIGRRSRGRHLPGPVSGNQKNTFCLTIGEILTVEARNGKLRRGNWASFAQKSNESRHVYCWRPSKMRRCCLEKRGVGKTAMGRALPSE